MFDQETHIMVFIGLVFLLSQVGRKLSNLFSVPHIIGYLFMGMLVGPCIFNLFSEEVINKDLYLIQEFALAIIAFSIGKSLQLDKIKKLKGAISVVALLQSLFTFLIISGTCVLYFYVRSSYSSEGSYTFAQYMPVAVFLGAINVATAPAVLLSIIKEYKAKGKLTTILLGIIALSDAITILIFNLTLNYNINFIEETSNTLPAMLVEPLWHIGVSIAIGTTVAFLLKIIHKYFLNDATAFSISLGSILFTTGIAISMNASFIIALMTFGFITVNFNRKYELLCKVVQNIEEPIFGMFFLLAGAHLRIDLLTGITFVAVLLIFARFAGKYIGCYVGGITCRNFQPLRRHAGIALMPQAGIAIALTFKAKAIVPDPHLADLMVSIVLTTTIINEFISPFMVKYALKNSGDIQPSKFAHNLKINPGSLKNKILKQSHFPFL